MESDWLFYSKKGEAFLIIHPIFRKEKKGRKRERSRHIFKSCENCEQVWNKNGKKNLISHLDHVTSRQLETEEVSREFPFRGLESTVAFSLEGGGKKEKKEERKKEKKK